MKKLYPALFSIVMLMLFVPLISSSQTIDRNGNQLFNNVDSTSHQKTIKNKKAKKEFITKNKENISTSINNVACTSRSWVQDKDRDNYYTGEVLVQCDYPGTDWVPFAPGEEPGDCDDNNPDVNPATIWVVDVDHDGYYAGTGNPDTQCIRPGDEYLLKIDEKPGDCDDGNASVHPRTWVIDADNDGYYSGNPVIQCYSPGDNYIMQTNQQPGDCDDNNAAINPATTWVLDNDLDGYYTGDPVTQCTSPGSRYVILINQQPGDCNDNDPSINPATEWVQDYDGDGYYTGDVVTQCYRPGAYYVIKTYQQPGDCDDYDPLVSPGNVWVLDSDGDGWYTGDFVQQCYSPGNGYIRYTNQYNEQPGDCNDNDPSINPATLWVLDADGDNYYSGDPITQCISPGEGYVIKTDQEQPGDCDDNDPSVNPATLWVLDMDGDGYYTGDPVQQCAIWERGWVKWNANYKPGDCDDNDASINPSTMWVLDADNDGYYTGDPVTQCTSPGAGYVIKTNQQPGDCNDNDSSVTLGVKWVLDADGDGYYSGQPVTQCTSPGIGYIKLTDRKELPGDCDDNNATVHPGAVEICGNGIDDNCNGQIDEGCAVNKINIRIADEAHKEGNKGQKNMIFNVTLNKKSTQQVQVNYTTQDNTATAGSDYVATNGTLTFAAGAKKQQIVVLINGDKTVEPDETFKVILSNPVNAAIIDSTGYGTILNDDGKAAVAAKTDASHEETSAIQKNIRLFPNPAQQKFTIELTGYTGNVIIEISSLDGRALQQIKLTGVTPKYTQQQIDLAKYVNGVYLVTVIDEITVIDEKGNSKTLKLIVVK